MSAGEHEAVQVDVNPSDVVGEEDLGGEAAAGGESRAPRSASNFFEMLQSTEPSESPEMQDGTLSTSATWYQHAELAMKKITGSTGTPAWLNLVMAAILAVVQQGQQTDESSSTNATGGIGDDVQVT